MEAIATNREGNAWGHCGSNEDGRSQGWVFCANCGGGGHTFRVCDSPITSFGVVCVRTSQHTGKDEFLVVQRKDSLCYVEFIRGKYNVQNRAYVARLLSNMTHEERARLLVHTFDQLWYGFWQDDRSKNYMKEYHQSRLRFETLFSGVRLRTAPSGSIVDVDLAALIVASEPGFDETEWGFPKGRRNINEVDIKCAMREFHEETGIASADVVSVAPFRKFEEVFTGSNRVRYRHVYYVVRVTAQDMLIGREGSAPPRPVSSHQTREIRRVAWFSRDEVLKRIRPSQVERTEMFKRLCNYVADARGVTV